MSDLIQDLKNNKLPVCKMPTELREKMADIKGNQFQILQTISTPHEDRWGGLVRGKTLTENSTHILRLRPDYAEKPKVVDCEVFVNGQGSSSPSLMYKREGDPTPNTYLSKAPEHPDFIGFKYEDGMVTGSLRRYKITSNQTWSDAWVALGDLEECEVLTPTHVLFKGATK